MRLPTRTLVLQESLQSKPCIPASREWVVAMPIINSGRCAALASASCAAMHLPCSGPCWRLAPPGCRVHALLQCAAFRSCRAKGLRCRNSPTCTLSQNGYGDRHDAPIQQSCSGTPDKLKRALTWPLHSRCAKRSGGPTQFSAK